MPTRLTNIRLTRVDTVDRGANQKARVALWKRDDAEDDPDDYTEEEKLPSAAEAVDALAREYAKLKGVSVSEAYAKVLSSKLGARMYGTTREEEVSKRSADYRDARRRALAIASLGRDPYRKD